MILTPGAIDANNRLRERFAIVRAWLNDHPDAAAKLGHLKVHFDEWDAFENESFLFRDETKLQGFEGNLAQIEDELKKHGYAPGEHVSVGDVLARTVGGKAAEQIDEAVKSAEKAVVDIPKALPWYAWLAVGLAGLAVGSVAYAAIQLNPAVVAARSVLYDSDRRRNER